MTTEPDDDLHDLQAELGAELSMAERSWPEDGIPAGQWQYDPTDIERQEVGLRNLFGAAAALDGAVREQRDGQL